MSILFRGGMAISSLRFAFCMLVFSGCGSGGSPPPKTFPANGTISKAGKPVPGILVSIVPVGGAGLSAIGQSNSKGEFTLNVSQDVRGAMAGTYKVVLAGGASAMTSADYSNPGKKGGQPRLADAPYQKIWTNPSSSPLSVEITAGGPNLVQVKLD
jgi:hypothetical protein